MSLDGTQVRKGLTGHLWMGDVGATMPDDTATDIDTDEWVELGYTNEDALTMNVSTDSSDVPAWQSLTPVRTDITGQTVTYAFTLIQRNRETMMLAFNGGSFTDGGTPGDYVYSPPAAATSSEHAFVFEVIDGDIVDRYRLSRASVSDLGDVVFKKDDPTGFEITLTALAAAGEGSPWDLVSNDPALSALAS